MKTFTDYCILLDNLSKKYNLTLYKEQEVVYELSNGNTPIFKLMYNKLKKSEEFVIVLSFHLDTNCIDAIDWYIKITHLVPEILLTESYYKDDYGESYLGQTAEVIKQYKLEQSILGNWTKGSEEVKSFVKNKISGRQRPEREKGYTSSKDAEKEFYIMQKEDEDKCH